MNMWLYRHFRGYPEALATWHPTHEAGAQALRDALKAHQIEGRRVDPSTISATIEHRYSVSDGQTLMAVYWLSEHVATSTAAEFQQRANNAMRSESHGCELRAPGRTSGR